MAVPGEKLSMGAQTPAPVCGVCGTILAPECEYIHASCKRALDFARMSELERALDPTLVSNLERALAEAVWQDDSKCSGS